MGAFPFYHSRIENDRSVLRTNARVLHRNLAAGVRSVAVIKADAYGHGAVSFARVLEDLYDMFAVANMSEAVELREAGVRHPLMVFGVPMAETALAYREYDIAAVVSSAEHFDLLEAGTSYHLEIDTGMGRLGFQPHDPEKLLGMVRSCDKLHCEAVMTHFASADEGDVPIMQLQKERLEELVSVFGAHYPIHAANSAASLAHPDTHVDMVRHGIALYGYDPTPQPSDEIRPVMKWISRIAQCKPVRQGQSLSYGATWQAPRDGYYAVIPTGYADGYRRNLSGRMPVQIEGNWYPQVGRVTMDYIMVWLGDDRFDAGTEVLVMGGERNHAGLFAEAIGTIPYEICCGIHTKVPRLLVG